jgi:hypothetical protein
MSGSKNGLMLIGAIIAVMGLLAIAVPAFTTERTKDIAKIGDLKLQTKEETTHWIPPFVGPVVLGLGIVLVGAGALVRR